MQCPFHCPLIPGQVEGLWALQGPREDTGAAALQGRPLAKGKGEAWGQGVGARERHGACGQGKNVPKVAPATPASAAAAAVAPWAQS